MRIAGGAGLLGALGSWLGWLEVSPAEAACPSAELSSDCSWICTERDRNGCCISYSGSDCYGWGGGGVVKTPSGSAQASFSGDKLELPGSRTQVITGTLAWFDPGWHGTGLLLESTRVTNYRRVPGTKIRELTGLASANGKGKHQFVMRVIDAGRPGSGADRVSLRVSGIAASGAGGTGHEYAAHGHLAEGDLTVHLQAAVIPA
jgi:hypothetical protein